MVIFQHFLLVIIYVVYLESTTNFCPSGTFLSNEGPGNRATAVVGVAICSKTSQPNGVKVDVVSGEGRVVVYDRGSDRLAGAGERNGDAFATGRLVGRIPESRWETSNDLGGSYRYGAGVGGGICVQSDGAGEGSGMGALSAGISHGRSEGSEDESRELHLDISCMRYEM